MKKALRGNFKRCSWVDLNSDIYIEYHDNEWGVPVHDDDILFEMLVLESFQSGLSWITILKKREDFRKAFDNFDANKISKYDDLKKEELLQNKNIIRNRLKIEATVNNAVIFLQIQKEFGSFSKYLWAFSDNKVVINNNNKKSTASDLSDVVSEDFKKRGMKFIGPVTIYAYLQSVGIVNDHDIDCFMNLQQDNNKINMNI
ncbi:MAG: DNA-3-methyladenine glycosylase I [Synergistaceae bacterium]|nr:DNA-3-methyladenine glycosylase I [Synergistaceae bacterium]